MTVELVPDEESTIILCKRSATEQDIRAGAGAHIIDMNRLANAQEMPYAHAEGVDAPVFDWNNPFNFDLGNENSASN
ncbi:hypothetical protein DFQ30_000016 [Apophysomyces sp. BC1015]|nr:hypothetical protein DFQ30_000016 [Apophysomyces sp. BC1015]